MNTTACEPGWAQDEFVYSTAPESREECILNLAFFNSFVAIIVLIQFVNAVVITNSVLGRAKRMEQKLQYGQYQTILFPWCTLITVLLFIVLPNTIGTGNNVMLCLLGLMWQFFNLTALRWVAKVHRLGARLIVKRLPEAKPILQAIKPDRVVARLMILAHMVCTAQFICLCILAVVFYQDAVWVQAGFGLNAVFVSLVCLCALHQTEKCRHAVRDTIRQVGDMLSPDTLVKYEEVQTRFRNQQLLFAFFGGMGILICALAAGEVFPIDHRVLLTALGLDAAGTLSMFLSTLSPCIFWGARHSSDKLANSPANSKLSPTEGEILSNAPTSPSNN
ncbi:hypothetical protein BASA81_000335 [Batrachochytrium salamandrivorans]|nr:hypothetical protein BASA81_000335 [Batrachochytrium salamandrivorans]